jgi:hypothetical protein
MQILFYGKYISHDYHVYIGDNLKTVKVRGIESFVMNFQTNKHLGCKPG